MDIGNQINEHPKRSFRTVLMILAIVLVLIIVGVWLWQSRSVDEQIVPQTIGDQNQPPESVLPQYDTTSSIIQDLEGIDIKDLESEFKDIDVDLNKL